MAGNEIQAKRQTGRQMDCKGQEADLLSLPRFVSLSLTRRTQIAVKLN